MSEDACTSCGGLRRALPRVACRQVGNHGEPSSLRAELAEAQAEIARLERDLRLAEGHLLDTNVAFEQKCNKLAERSAIIEAATALVKYRRDPGPNPTRLELERRIAAVDDAVAAVEEGGKT